MKKTLGILLVGLVLGILGTVGTIKFLPQSCLISCLLPRPPRRPSPEKILKKLEKELNLSNVQKEQIRKILDDEFPKIKLIHSSARRQMDLAQKEIQRKISAVLTPEQQAQHQRLIEKFERRRRNREPGPF